MQLANARKGRFYAQYAVKLSMLHTSPFSTSLLRQNLAATGRKKRMKRGKQQNARTLCMSVRQAGLCQVQNQLKRFYKAAIHGSIAAPAMLLLPPPCSSDVNTRWLSGYSHNSTLAGASKNTIINQQLILPTVDDLLVIISN
jgi:hypothetical protein